MKNKKKFYLMVVSAIILICLSFGSFAASTAYSSITGGSGEVYFTKTDGNLYVTQPNSTKLVQVKGLSNIQMAADDVYFGLWAMDKSGYVYYCNLDTDNQNTCLDKKKIEKLGKVKYISIGSEGIYALKSDGTVWGVNHELSVFKVEGLSGVSNIAIKDFDVVALKKDGTVWHWRDDAVITDYAKKRKLAQVPGLKDVKQVSAGADCGLALKKDNTVWQWSFSSDASVKPIQIKGFGSAKSIEAGRMEAYAIDSKGNVWTWKQYGDKVNKPSQIKGFTGITSIVASGKDSYDGFNPGRLVALDKNYNIKIYDVGF